MEIVELLPGVFVRFELYCRVRALSGILALVLLVLIGDRTGVARLDVVPDLPPSDARAPARRAPGRPARSGPRGGLPADLPRSVPRRAHPAARADVLHRLGAASGRADDARHGDRRGHHHRTREVQPSTLRAEGRAPDQERLRAFEDPLRVMAPALALARFSQVGSEDGAYGFLLSTEPTRDPGGH